VELVINFQMSFGALGKAKRDGGAAVAHVV
jgi:hypothetical protein